MPAMIHFTFSNPAFAQLGIYIHDSQIASAQFNTVARIESDLGSFDKVPLLCLLCLHRFHGLLHGGWLCGLLHRTPFRHCVED